MSDKSIGWNILLIATCLEIAFQGAMTADCGGPCYGKNCTFLCHCTGAVQCDLTTGECPSKVTCTAGTFGPACQFNDSMKEFGPPGNQAFLSDANLQSCNPDKGATSLTVSMRAPIYVTWIRIHTDIDMSTHDLQVQLDKGPCLNRMLYRVSNTTLDVTCDSTVQTRLISFKGAAVGRICQMEISGGRNVALKQKALQSSFFASEDSPAKYLTPGNANDGCKNQDILGYSCIQTGLIPGDAWWTMEYNRPQKISRIIVYNQDDELSHLGGFLLELHDMRLTNNTKVFSYQDNPGNLKLVYDIPLTPSMKTVTFLKIIILERGQKNVTINLMTICEVDTYGETMCPEGMFGIDCEGTCKCGPQERCHPVTGLCGAPCLKDSSGKNCDFKCHPNCLSQRCQGPFCGFCVASDCLSCKPGFSGTYCDEVCPRGQHGDNCTLSCPKNCSGSTCNTTNGHCFSCAGSQEMPLCTLEHDKNIEEKTYPVQESTWYYLILLILFLPLAILLLCCFLKRRSHVAALPQEEKAIGQKKH